MSDNEEDNIERQTGVAREDPFAKYSVLREPDKAEKAYAWRTAIGLQDVDMLQPSEYLLNTAKDHIEGAISLEEARKRIESYYKVSGRRAPERTEEADKVSLRIAEILSENSFVFSPAQYISIHRRLFQDVYPHAGRIRDYNVSKKEWVLDGASVVYGGAAELRETLDYDFRIEQEFDYANLSMTEIIRRLARFVSRLWQIHIFEEGNTRATAVFFIKYVRSLGFHATNDVFATNAWYFRNALARANYSNLQAGIREDLSYLEIFLRNLLMGEKHDLKNRRLHIAWKDSDDWDKKQPIGQPFEQPFEENNLLKILEAKAATAKTKANIIRLYREFGKEKIFGRGDVMKALGLTERPATALIGKAHELELTEKITGVGKGKYRFIV